MSLDRIIYNIKCFLLSPRGWARHVAKSKPAIVECDAIGNFSRYIARANRGTVGGNGVILIASFMPIIYCLKLEAVLGRALESRGYKIVVLSNLESGSLASRIHQGAGGYELELIENSIKFVDYVNVFISLVKIPIGRWNEELFVKSFKFNDAPIGLHCLATYHSSFIASADLASPKSGKALKRLARRGALLSLSASRIIAKYRPRAVLSVEKGFIGTCEVFYAALNQSIDFIQWTSCHEPDSLMLKRYAWERYRDHPFSIATETWAKILEMPANPIYFEEVHNQFSRGYGDGNWFSYKKLASGRDQVSRAQLMCELQLKEKKTAIIFSHILNDANLFYGQDLFEKGYEEWLVETVRAASKNSAVNWVLKLHPANMYRNKIAGYAGEYGEILALKRAFGNVPEFLTVVYPDSNISPFSFFKLADYGITVRGTVGLELPCLGVPVITAGSGRYSGKGFTIDSSTRERYLELIENIQNLQPLSDAQVELAIRYAYFVFFMRPAKYSSCIKDTYNHEPGHPLHRDLIFTKACFEDVCNSDAVGKMVNYILSSRVDYLDCEFD